MGGLVRIVSYSRLSFMIIESASKFRVLNVKALLSTRKRL